MSGALLAGLLSLVSFATPVAALSGGKDSPSISARPDGKPPAQESESTTVKVPAPVWPKATGAVVDLKKADGEKALAVTPSGKVVEGPAGSKAAGDAVVSVAPAEAAGLGPRTAGRTLTDLPGASPSPEATGAAGTAKDGKKAEGAEGTEEGTASELAEKLADPPVKVKVEVLDRKAVEPVGGVGMGLRLTGADGTQEPQPVEVSLDYGGFRHAYGGDFAERLRLVKMPACALVTPKARKCSTREFVEADNDVEAGTLTAVLEPDADPSAERASRASASTSGATVYAVTSGSSSDQGDYRASPLSQSGKWDVSTGSGAFTYSVPIELPKPPMGQAPELALTYNSQSVDGRTSASNNQSSWLGMGWDLNVGFIERRYTNCAEDGHPTFGDLCWDSPNSANEPSGAAYVINLDGVSSQLIQDGNGTGSYHVQDDPGWRVQRLTHDANDWSKDYWVISHQDGSRYYFGWGKSQRTDAATNSALKVPVVGDDAGEPCHGSFPEPCTQTWRWNLDRSVDANEVETAYFYDKESNYYRSVAATDKARKYDSGSYLKKIEYGWSSQIAGAQLPAWVDFSHANRCVERVAEDNPLDNAVPACPSIESSPESYPDVPLDLLCDGSSDDYACRGKTYYPTFFLKDMLWDIKTYVQDTNASSDDLVMQYQMKYGFPNPEGTIGKTLWLDYIQRKAYGNDPNLTLPVINFNGIDIDNQVGTGLLNYRRVNEVHDDLGSVVNVTYGHATDEGGTVSRQCDPANLPSQSSNTSECFWQKWTPEGSETEKTGWFKKFVVTKVVVDPGVAKGANSDAAPSMTTTYEYDGGAGWRFPNDPMVKDEDETWSEWRGYGRVAVTTGANENQHSTYHWLHRGLDGDRTSKTDSSATRSVKVTDPWGTEWTDHAWLAGKELALSKRDHNGDAQERVLREYWTHNTAQYTGLPDARFVREEKTTTRTKVAGSTDNDSTWRETVVVNDYDSAETPSWKYGLPLRLDEWGETGVSDNRCTTYGRAYNTDTLDGTGTQRWTVLTDEVRTYSVTCASRDTATNMNSFVVTLYDGAADEASNKPVDGNPTEVHTYTGASSHRVTRSEYDDAGRVVKSWDGKGNLTTTAYSPTTSWPVDGVKVTGPDPDGTGPGTPMTTTTWSSRHWGSPWKIVDANGNTTRIDLDAAGRTLKVWKATEEASYPDGNASMVFSYTTPTHTNGSNVPDVVNGPTRVTSKTLRSGSAYLTSYAYSDGLGRVRETQTVAPDGTGRNVVSTRYDSSGNVTGTSSAFYNSGAAGSGMVLPEVADLPSYNDVVVDWAGRTTLAKIMVNGVDQNAGRTETQYYGNMTRVIPPTGDRTDTYTDAYGRTSKVVEYNGAQTYETTYTYTRKDELKTITDSLGNVTRYGYDWAGQRISADDPDAGTGTTTYDALGKPETVTDGNGTTVTTVYDNLGRPKEIKQGDTVLVSYTYDTVAGGKGLLASSTSHQDGNAYTTAVTAYDKRGRATGRKTTVPAAEGALAGSYTTGYRYDAMDRVTEIDYPAAGGLPAETVTTGYTAQGLASTVTSPLAAYVSRTDYDNLARLTARTYGSADTTDTTASRAYTYNDTNGTGALQTVRANTSTGGLVQNDTYARDDSGVILSTTDAIAAQRECFRYDKLQRLTAAWTVGSAAECAASGALNTDFTKGPDPYQTEYAYDRIGNVRKVTDTTVTGATVRDYHYPGYSADGSTYTAGADRPHAVSKVVTKDGSGTETGTDTFTYDNAGRLQQRTSATPSSPEGITSTATWSPQQRFTGMTAAGTSAGYVYDAEGDLVVRKDSTGQKVLYLDGQELRASGSTATATRYYASDKAVVAMRVAGEGNGTLTWLMSDAQTSTQLAITVATGAVLRRRYTPFGDQRGQTGLPTGTDRGFLGKTEDPVTGLSLLGARPYDPQLGRFLAPDPIATPYKVQNLNAYSYSANNPVMFSDPSGLALEECRSGMYTCDRGVRPTGYGKNYEYVVQANGGTLAPDYVRWKNQVTYSCQHDPGCRTSSLSFNAGYKAASKKPAPPKVKVDSNWWSSAKSGFSSFAGGVKDTAAGVGDFFQENWREIAKWGVWIVGGVAIAACTAATAGVCAGAGGLIISAAIGASQGAAAHALDGGEATAGAYAKASVYGVATVVPGAAFGKVTMLAQKTAGYHSISTISSEIFRSPSRFYGAGKYGRQVYNHMGFGTRYVP
ncbi:RHS repeat-associated core domain-containing protein [Streptomyces thermolineatus]|uniref:RHS repeat-associated core domain-containing protein n=1 Tax=Streptomyces thermolineatus TaxID=44033 RepID=A0ABP5XZ28_9ACTN